MPRPEREGGSPLDARAPGARAGAARLDAAHVVLDCRWLALRIGAARVIELLLADFRASPPPGRWTLWGPRETLELAAFPGAEIEPSHRDPRSWAGQRELLRVPKGDVAVYMHQIRPLCPGLSVTVIHDTISLRHGGGRAARLAKRLLFTGTARLSTQILTDSEFAKACIVRDLGVPAERIAVMRFPVDAERSAAVARQREARGQVDRLLYIGRFLPHKNLDRLCAAFQGSRFAKRGGTLVLAGGWDGEVDALAERLAWRGIEEGIELRPACPQDELDRLMATSRALVLPSLEEGYGLPAFEAAATGLPVAASRTGATTNLPPERAVLFDPTDVEAMRAAIDEATSRPPRPPMPAAPDTRTAFRDVVLGAIERALAAAATR